MSTHQTNRSGDHVGDRVGAQTVSVAANTLGTVIHALLFRSEQNLSRATHQRFRLGTNTHPTEALSVAETNTGEECIPVRMTVPSREGAQVVE